MKFLVDTCGWLEVITKGPLCSRFVTYLKQADQLLVPTIIQYELFKWVSRELDEASAWSVISVTEKSQVMPLDTAMALEAADLSSRYQLSMADAMIYAYSRRYQLELITCDQHFASLADVTYFAKQPAVD